MNSRQKFKQCLVRGWLTHRVWQCAAMVMIDEGIIYDKENKNPDMARIENFLRDIVVPPYQQMQVSRYIAAFYPKTSEALFENNPRALQIFWKEKQQLADRTKTLKYERASENRKNKQILFIKLRELTKWHDWKTVK